LFVHAVTSENVSSYIALSEQRKVRATWLTFRSCRQRYELDIYT
jgi:hypothetical protein